MNLWQIIKEDLNEPKRQDPAFNSIVELLFNYPGVWAIVNYRFAHFFYKKGLKRLARAICGISAFITNVDIHPAATIGRHVFLDHAFGIVIGETAIIGDFSLIYQGVTLGGVNLSRSKRHPTLQNGVVVGAGAKILGDIVIGENSKIGANSVVIKNVPPNSTAVGIPAKIVSKNTEIPLSHDKIPDINKEIFKYLMKRINILEEILLKENKTLQNRDFELYKYYESYLNSLEN